MKKIFLLIAAPFVFLSAFSVPLPLITQEQADKVVLERMSQETLPYIISVKDGLQTKMAIITTNGEKLELDYPCWVYYVNYPTVNCCIGRHLIVNAYNGNLLEINAKGNAVPNDLAAWQRVYPVTIETYNYSLPQGCEWDGLTPDLLYLINSREEIVQHIACDAHAIFDVDFDKYTLMVLQPKYCNIDSKVEKLLLQQLSSDKYLLAVDVIPGETAVTTLLAISILVPKITETESVELDMNIIRNSIEKNGYLVGYATCGLTIENGLGYAKEYIFISEDLKDTLAVYNLPQDIYDFPEEIFTETEYHVGNMSFPEQYRYAFKIQLAYTVSSEEEVHDRELKVYCVINGMYPWIETYKNCVPIIVNSAQKIEENTPFSAIKMTNSVNHFSMEFFANSLRRKELLK